MPVTASVNGMTVVHKASTGISQAFPDVCKTPAPPAPPVPIPYPNIAMSAQTADGSTTVKVDGNPIMLSTSTYSMSSGDEAGSLFGVMSNKVKGSANPQSWSMDVKVDGKNVFRQLDLMLQNGGSKPINTPPGPNNQAPLPPSTPSSKQKDWKLVETQWSDPKKKCGDMVKIRTKVENYPNGIPVMHVAHKNGGKSIHAMFSGQVNGSSVDIDWITENGRWQKKPTKLKVKAHGAGETRESSNELEIEVPAEMSTRVMVGAAANVHAVLAKVKVPKTVLGIPIPFWKKEVIQPSGRLVAWAYGYDMSIKQGVFQIHCKLRLRPQVGVKLSKMRKAKKGWKKEIEGVWDKKWKEHRIACQRGDKCACPGGCCIFPIRVKCTFVPAGEHIEVNVWPGAPTGTAVGANPNWWNCYNWYEKASGYEGNYAVVHAHEFGHNIGMADEYVGGSINARFFDVSGSLMQSGSDVQKQHLDTHPFGGVSIHARFQAVAGDRYKLLPM